MLMKGSIISAGEGNRNAAREAKYAARFVLSGVETHACPSTQAVGAPSDAMLQNIRINGFIQKRRDREIRHA